MHYVRPVDQERYYLRMLLNHVPGATSYEFLRTVKGVIHSNFEGAAEALGLLNNEKEWEKIVVEALDTQCCALCRDLFGHLLIFCPILKPAKIWEILKITNREFIEFGLPQPNRNNKLLGEILLNKPMN